MRETKLATVDVWDTLLRRRCHPDAAKLHVARILLLQRAADIAAPFRHPRSLLSLRLSVESDLARKTRQDPECDDEYAHAEVMREWLTRACGKQCGQDATLLAELTTSEIEHEAFVTYVDSGAARTLQIWRSHSQRLLFLSDFYLPAATLAELIRQTAPGVEFDGGLTSADERLNKRSGRLFKRVQALEGVSAQEHRHLGDNRISDVAVPRALGIEAHHHLERAEERLRRRRLRDFAEPQKHVQRLDRECRRQLRSPEPTGRSLQDLAAGVAPLFAGFALFIAEHARRDAVEKLFFLTREGEFLKQIFDTVTGEYPAMAATLPPARMLQVSRMSTFGPSLSSLQPNSLNEGLERLWKAFPEQSLIALALSLGIDADVMRQAATRYGINADLPVNNISADSRVRELLRDHQFRDVLRHHLEGQRHRLQTYLRQNDFADCGRAGIVDIGWHGSMQDNLSQLQPAQKSFGYYLGLQKSLNTPAAQTRRQAYGPNQNDDAESDHSRLRLFSHLPTLELLCASSAGSVTGYQMRSGRTTALREPLLPSQRHWYERVAAPWQSAVVEGVRHWARSIHDQALGSEDLRDLALKRWSRMVNRPPGWLRDALKHVEHDERFGRGRSAPAPPPRRGLRGWLSF